MAHLDKIQPNQILVGDILHVVVESMIFANQKVITVEPVSDYIRTVATDDGKTEGFVYTDDYWKFYLVERPKKPLPTKIGSVVEVAGVKYVRILKDNDYNPEWAFDGEGYITEISSERLSELDYTVV